MRFTKKQKLLLIGLLLVTALTLAAQIILFKQGVLEKTYFIESMYLSLLIPAFVFTTSFLILMYFNWFYERASKGLIGFIKKIFFLFLATSFFIIWVNAFLRFLT